MSSERHYISADKRRMVTFYAIACSEGKPDDTGHWEGEVIGTTWAPNIAQAFLDGIEVPVRDEDELQG
jgi:hypothetical protein